MTSQLTAFFEAAQADPSLMEKLNTAADSSAVAAIANDAGFSVSVDELNALMSDLTDEQLSSVSGGMDTASQVGLGVGVGVTVVGWGTAIGVGIAVK